MLRNDYDKLQHFHSHQINTIDIKGNEMTNHLS